MATDVLARHNVHVLGGGTQPMVFAHGFGCDQNMWRYVVPAFEDEYRTVLFDYVGHGQSDRAAYDPNRYTSLQGFADDLLEIVRALDLRDVVLVGHSVSTIIAILAANTEPERFASLILIGPSPRYVNDPPDYHGGFQREDIDGLLSLMDKNYIGWAGALAPMVARNDDRPELAAELNASFCSTDPVVARRFAELTFLGDNRADLAQVSVPTLILQGSDDAIAPDSVGAYVHRTIPGSVIRRLAAQGHAPHLSHPDETIAAMRDYLRGGVPA